MIALERPNLERHGHWSLRFDVPAEILAELLVDLIAAEHLTLLTTTESRSAALVHAVRRRLPAGYAVARRFEYLIIWHRPTYRSHTLARLATLDPRGWPMMGGRRLFRVTRKRFTHRATRTRLRVEVAHAPSGVDAGAGNWSHAHHDRVTIANDGFARWGNRVRRYRRRHPRGAAVLHMDSNLNQRWPQWRAFLERRLSAESIWSGPGAVLDQGTHGERLIDTGHAVNLEISGATPVHPHRPHGVDHAPFVYTAGY